MHKISEKIFIKHLILFLQFYIKSQAFLWGFFSYIRAFKLYELLIDVLSSVASDITFFKAANTLSGI